MNFSYLNINRYIVEGLSIFFFFIICFFLSSSEFFFKHWVSLILSVVTFIVCFIHFRVQERINLFSPVNLFCVYYITIPLVNIYFAFSDFSSSTYFNKSYLSGDYVKLFTLSCFYYLIGIITFLIGYSLVRKNKVEHYNFSPRRLISNKGGISIVILFLFVGIINFLYNYIFVFGGSLSGYLTQTALNRFAIEEKGGTTVGYNLYYMACYLLTFLVYRENWKKGFWYIIIILCGGILEFSNGMKVFGGIFFIIPFIAIHYLYNIISDTNKKFNRKYLLLLVIFLFSAITMYFLRQANAATFKGETNSTGLFGAATELVEEDFSTYLIDKGNMPNTPLMLLIIDNWGNSQEYLYGNSFWGPVYAFLPSDVREEVGDLRPSSILQNLWGNKISYASGALPPTAVGEMYMNFGPLGPIFGMFFVGFLFKIFFNYCNKKQSFWYLMLAAKISVSFIFIYPKVEFANLSIWFFLYIFIPFITAQLISKVIK